MLEKNDLFIRDHLVLFKTCTGGHKYSSKAQDTLLIYHDKNEEKKKYYFTIITKDIKDIFYKRDHLRDDTKLISDDQVFVCLPKNNTFTLRDLSDRQKQDIFSEIGFDYHWLVNNSNWHGCDFAIEFVHRDRKYE